MTQWQLLKNTAFRQSFGVSILAILASLISVFYSTRYATINSSNHVTDIILSNTRVYDVGLIFVYGALAAVIFSIIVCLALYFERTPFMLKTAALFLFIRSVFVSLTHISPYPNHAVISDTFLTSTSLAQMFFTGDDLFFSGHVGLTFLMALMLWDNPLLRYIYLGISALFAVTVLLGHFHYSIDVFAAFFITHTIYLLGVRFFPTDYARGRKRTTATD